MKFLLMQSSSLSHFDLVRPKYLPHHPILEHPQPMFLIQYERQISNPYKTTSKITVLYILIFTFLDSELEDEKFCTRR
jgi:hypothetical protein